MNSTAETALTGPVPRLSLAHRTALLALLLFGEKFLLNFVVDFDASIGSTGFGAVVRVAQHWVFRFIVSGAIALALFVYVRADQHLRALNAGARFAPLRPLWLMPHLLLLLPLWPLSASLYGGHGLHWPLPLLVGLWLACALPAILFLATALAPWNLWREAARGLGTLWAYAGCSAAVATALMSLSARLWEPTARFTFSIVVRMLHPLIPDLQADPVSLVIVTQNFAVQIAEACSGLEGVGLMLACTGAWLIYFRKEYILPRALLIIPLGVVLIFALNSVRIALLVLIGNAGHPQVAIYGFHSQAGWIMFNLAACLVAYAAHHSAWLNRLAAQRRARPDVESASYDNPTAAYLSPLLALLVCGTLAHSMSNGFETLYVLRPIGVLLALVYAWPKLRTVNRRFSWRGPVVGLIVLAVWLLFAHWLLPESAMPATLASMSLWGKTTWLVIRVLAAVITVPLAEELAYRGFLLRRFATANFDTAPYAAAPWYALIISSVIFGAAHGPLWIPGIFAGVAYGLLTKRTGKLGEAIAAHAVSNAGIAVVVLSWQQWQLW